MIKMLYFMPRNENSSLTLRVGYIFHLVVQRCCRNDRELVYKQKKSRRFCFGGIADIFGGINLVKFVGVW
ncbi:MAG TPA: hypothetical protein DDW90_00730 [Cyanobacteria bacterium UBA9971]|nr:hypothetical protein [Cyanobacteria bacterium UBA9971]